MPTYLKYEYIFSLFRFKVRSGFAFFFSSGFASFQPDSDPWKKCRILIPAGIPNRYLHETDLLLCDVGIRLPV